MTTWTQFPLFWPPPTTWTFWTLNVDKNVLDHLLPLLVHVVIERPLIFLLLFLYRLIYNICRCVVQFVMPMLVVLGVYISIFWRLKNRPISKNSTNYKRRRRTNIMVISVSITFFLSWLPLNTLNFLLDVESLNKHSKEVRIKTNF